MAATISVPYTILTDSGIVEGNPHEGPYAVVRFKCLTSDRYQLVKDLLGTTVASNNQITRTYPYAYPPSPNLIAWSVDQIDQIGPGFLLGFGAKWVGREYSIVTCRFQVATFFDNNSDPSGKPYTTTTFDASGEALTLPQSCYKFGDGTPTNTPPGILIPQIAISMRRHMLPYLPLQQVASLIGHVNNAVVTIGNFGFPAGTLLFTGGPSTISPDPQGNIVYEVEYRMIYRYQPWNYFLHPNGTTGWAVVLDGNGAPVFPSGDFSILP